MIFTSSVDRITRYPNHYAHAATLRCRSAKSRNTLLFNQPLLLLLSENGSSEIKITPYRYSSGGRRDYLRGSDRSSRVGSSSPVDNVTASITPSVVNTASDNSCMTSQRRNFSCFRAVQGAAPRAARNKVQGEFGDRGVRMHEDRPYAKC